MYCILQGTVVIHARGLCPGVSVVCPSQGLIRQFRDVKLGGRLQAASTGGAPNAPDVTAWLDEALGFPLANNYGSTEAGLVMLSGRMVPRSALPTCCSPSGCLWGCGRARRCTHQGGLFSFVVAMKRWAGSSADHPAHWQQTCFILLDMGRSSSSAARCSHVTAYKVVDVLNQTRGDASMCPAAR